MQIVRDITAIQEPTCQVITLAEAKNYLKVDYNEDDDIINSLILSAQKRLEQYAGIAFTPRTLQTIAYVDAFIELPYAPISIVLNVELFRAGEWIELTQGEDFYLVGPTYTKVYIKTYPSSEFRFTYQCGYNELPESIKTANLKLLADLYDFRSSESPNDRLNEIQMTAYELIQPFKRINYFI